MQRSGSNTIVRYEDSDQVMVTGFIEDLSERNLSFAAKQSLILNVSEEENFVLVCGGEVDGIEHLSAKRVSIFGTIDEAEFPPTITVLGYRVHTQPSGTDDNAPSGRSFLKKKAA